MRQPAAALLRALLLVLLVLAATAARAERFALGVRAGTAGLGPELAVRLSDRAHVRLLGGFSSHHLTYEETGIRYDGTLELRNAPLLLDWHPGGGGFRVSLGAAWDANELEVSAPLSELVRRERPELLPLIRIPLGSLVGRANVEEEVVPYAGLGWGRPFHGGRAALSFDVGVLYQGSPRVTLNLESRVLTILPPALSDAVWLAVQDEEQRLERELEDYRYYPVVALGVTFRP